MTEEKADCISKDLYRTSRLAAETSSPTHPVMWCHDTTDAAPLCHRPAPLLGSFSALGSWTERQASFLSFLCKFRKNRGPRGVKIDLDGSRIPLKWVFLAVFPVPIVSITWPRLSTFPGLQFCNPGKWESHRQLCSHSGSLIQALEYVL